MNLKRSDIVKPLQAAIAVPVAIVAGLALAVPMSLVLVVLMLLMFVALPFAFVDSALATIFEWQPWLERSRPLQRNQQSMATDTPEMATVEENSEEA